jgi:FkbM family methyltransferase
LLCFGERSGELGSYVDVFVNKHYEDYAQDEARAVILDIGANIGLFSIKEAQCNSQARIFAFEPNSCAFSRLVRNLALNGIENVLAINCAVYSKSGRLALKAGAATVLGKVEEPPKGGTGGSTVPAVTVDEFCAESRIEAVTCMKIDVEGAEVEVLRGAQSTLQGTKYVAVECHSPQLRRATTAILSRFNFALLSERKLGDTWVLRFARATGIAGPT